MYSCGKIYWHVTQGFAACEDQKLTPSPLDIYNLDADWLKWFYVTDPKLGQWKWRVTSLKSPYLRPGGSDIRTLRKCRLRLMSNFFVLYTPWRHPWFITVLHNTQKCYLLVKLEITIARKCCLKEQIGNLHLGVVLSLVHIKSANSRRSCSHKLVVIADCRRQCVDLESWTKFNEFRAPEKRLQRRLLRLLNSFMWTSL